MLSLLLPSPHPGGRGGQETAREEEHHEAEHAAEQEQTDRAASAPPRLVLVKFESGSMMNAPRTGPQRVPRPPSSADSTISMLVMMSKTALVLNVT